MTGRRNGAFGAAGRIVTLSVALVAAAVSGARGQEHEPAAGSEAARAVAILAEGLREHASLPGLAIAVGADGGIAYSGAWGVADLESRAPATTDTRFRIGSVGKSLTAAGAFLLSRRGRLDLDAPVRRNLPSIGGPAGAATARQLAGHLGGIRHYREDDFLVSTHYDDVADALELFLADSLVAPPGTRYAYSTHGYTLLSAVMQAAAGEPFLAWMDREVFEPLGMSATGPDDVTAVIPARASFYRIEGGAIVPARFTDNSYKWAGGGFLSTPEDLARFGISLLDGTLLGPGGAHSLFTTQRTSEGDETKYGMGFRPRSDWEGRDVAHHGGSSEGGRAFLLAYPEEGVVVAMAANRENAPLFEQEAQTIAHFWLDHGAGGIDDALAGAWTLRGSHGDDAITGELRLFAGGKIRGILAWSDEEAPIEILLVDRHGGRLRLIGAGPHGLMNAWLEPAASGWSGRWDYLGKGGDVSLERLARG